MRPVMSATSAVALMLLLAAPARAAPDDADFVAVRDALGARGQVKKGDVLHFDLVRRI